MNHSLRLSKSRLTSRPYGTDGLRMWSGPILGLLCGTPTYRSWFPQDNDRSICCKVHRLEPHPLDNYHAPYKNCRGINLIRHSHIPMLGGPLAQFQGILRVPPATPQCWPIAWSAASRKGFKRSLVANSRAQEQREDKWCVTMCHRKLVFHLTLDSVGGCASDRKTPLWWRWFSSRFMTRGRSSFQWLQGLQWEKFRRDIWKLRIAQNCGFSAPVSDGVVLSQWRTTETFVWIPNRQMTFEIGHPWVYLTTNVVFFLYLTSSWKMTGSCIISYIHGYLGLTCQALWENDPVLIWGWVKTNYYAHILGGITIHYPAISGYGPRGWLGY